MLVVMVRMPVASAEQAEQIVERFRHRGRQVDGYPGFLGFELFKGESECVSMTRWASQADLDNWMNSQAHARAHDGATHRPEPVQGGKMPQSGQGPGGMQGQVSVYEVAIPRESAD